MPMRIPFAFIKIRGKAMPVDFNPARQRSVKLSASIERLLAEFVSQQQQGQHGRQQLADACVADWNAVHARVGSFADEHVSS